jgi:hypothetical protein
MRASALAGATLLCTVTLFGAKKVISPNTTAGNDDIDIQATITLAEQEVAQKLGADPGKGIVLLHLRVMSKTDKPIQISPDDFILLAHDDGERSRPFAPAEIAGPGAMVLTEKGGITHTGSSIGFGGGMIGGGGASPGNPKVTTLATRMNSKDEGNAKLLQVLRAKELPQKETADPVEGYLYFPLDGKHKLKNLAVLYRGPAGKLNLEFEH